MQKSIQKILPRLLWLALGAAIGSFGIHYIHRQSDITEGGVLGMMLLLNHWLGISPSVLTPVMDIACYALAFRFLGFGFIKWSAVSTLFVGGFFKLWESLPPFFPSLAARPLLAAVLGALFVGVGVGILVRQGGSGGGDDALAGGLADVRRAVERLADRRCGDAAAKGNVFHGYHCGSPLT